MEAFHLCVFLCVVVLSTVTVNSLHIDWSKKCTLPPYPTHGFYEVLGHPKAVPGNIFNSFLLTVSCLPGYVAPKKNLAMCAFGNWSNEMPQCEGPCRVPDAKNMEYKCLVSKDDKEFRPCDTYVPSRTVMKSYCNVDIDSKNAPLSTCENGKWYGNDKEPQPCYSDCGTVDINATILPFHTDERLPWHVTIYQKRSNSYARICTGSIITTSTVLTAAHCFYSKIGSPNIPSALSVVAGKAIQNWDIHEQRRSVKDIKVHPSFHGTINYLVADIAIAILNAPVQVTKYVKPVCINFDERHKHKQFEAGNYGQVSLWPSKNDDDPSLRMINYYLRFVQYRECLTRVPRPYKAYITPDKICTSNSGGVCAGNSGAGLSFITYTPPGIVRHYLRGILSFTPKYEDDTNDTCTSSLVVYTDISYYKDFILTEMQE